MNDPPPGLRRFLPAIAWMTGNQAITCPALTVRDWIKPEDRDLSSVYQLTYDDETMRQFEAYLGKSLPGKPDDPGRYRQRFNWIMKNALPEWTTFRCRAMAGMYAKFAKAMRAKSPRMEMFVLEDHQLPSVAVARELEPFERLRTYCFDPREFLAREGLHFALMMPDHYEWFDRGRMSHNTEHWLADSERCGTMRGYGSRSIRPTVAFSCTGNLRRSSPTCPRTATGSFHGGA